ncbi:hypothetical protein [Sulfitobacter aestuariivivens]|uniref:hypothetical protein n=1 Tax=Sulfitobacter aestuariivivens TaxID=2766981 RepID=UPI00361AA932
MPKTAGSTVNAHLSGWGAGLDHVEHYRDRQTTLHRKLPRQAWVSGHLALNKMQALLGDAGGREVQYFGLIRTPLAQVMSHYNWLIEIATRGGRFFRAHPEGIRTYAQRLKDSDNTDPRVVLNNIEARRGMFLNLQSRFLLGDDLIFSKDTGISRLSQYAALRSDPDTLIADMTGQRPTRSKTTNASTYHFDKAVFEAPLLQDFLRKHNAHDLNLHARITARGVLDS